MADKVAARDGAVSRGKVLNYEPESLVIIDDPSDPRWDPRAMYPVDPAFLATILEHGVITPILVSKDGEDAEGNPRMVVVNGRQRVRAVIAANKQLRKAGKEPMTVPAVVDRQDAGTQAVHGIVTNEAVIRDTPIVRAQKMEHMLRSTGKSIAEVARMHMCSESAARELLSLLTLGAETKKAVEAGELPVATAKTMGKLSEKEQSETLAKLRAENALSGPKAKVIVAEALGPVRSRPVKSNGEHAGPSKAEVKKVLGDLEGVDKTRRNGLTGWLAGVQAALQWRETGAGAKAFLREVSQAKKKADKSGES